MHVKAFGQVKLKTEKAIDARHVVIPYWTDGNDPNLIHRESFSLIPLTWMPLTYFLVLLIRRLQKPLEENLLQTASLRLNLLTKSAFSVQCISRQGKSPKSINNFKFFEIIAIKFLFYYFIKIYYF